MAEAHGGFAVVVYRDDDQWEAGVLPDRLARDLDGLLAAVRQQPGGGTAIGLVDVADEFFVALRVRQDGEARVLLSDASAAADWELAAAALDRIEPDTEPPDEVIPAGDLAIFDDLGLDSAELLAILSDIDAYADEMIGSIAGRVGFADVVDRALATR
jgi:putative tRNA adenosine deaminase-associated protein